MGLRAAGIRPYRGGLAVQRMAVKAGALQKGKNDAKWGGGFHFGWGRKGRVGARSLSRRGWDKAGGVRGGRRNDFEVKTIVKINKKSFAFAPAMREIVERNKIGFEISTEG